MNLSEYEGLMEGLEELKTDSEEFPIIVEGRRDEDALRSLGVEGVFYRASVMPFYELCEEVSGKYLDVILFTDRDKAGEKLAKKLKSYFSQMGVRVKEKHRLTLMSKLDTHQVENLSKRLTKVERKFYKF